MSHSRSSRSSRHMLLAPAAPGQSRDQEPPPKRARLACQECRQNKVRCEPRSSVESCVRCERLRLECIFDHDFKRENKRLKVQELTEEVRLLRSVVGQSTNASAQSTTPGNPSANETPIRNGRLPLESVLSSSQDGSSSPHLQNETSEISEHSQPTHENSRPEAKAARQLGNVTLTARQIEHLFESYFTLYHPHIPLLSSTISADQYYSRSTVLFWVVVSIASRRDEEDSTLLAHLAPKVKDLVFASIGSPPHSRDTINASTAKASAMHVGLHRPEIVQDYSRIKFRFQPEELDDALKTWVGCFIAAESITSCVGQPSLFNIDPTLDLLVTTVQEPKLPVELMVLLQAFKFLNRVNYVMSNQESAAGKKLAHENGIIFSMLEKELQSLYNRIPVNTVGAELILLSMCLHFRTYYFLEPIGQPFRREGLLKGYAAATSFAFKAHAAQSKTRFLASAPNYYRHTLTIAAMYICKIAKSSYSADVDMQEARRAFSACHTLQRQMSLEDNDLSGRSAKIAEQLWNCEDLDRPHVEPSLKIKTRFGASLLHDSLWTWREKFGGQKSRRPSEPSMQVAASSTSAPGPQGPSKRDATDKDSGNSNISPRNIMGSENAPEAFVSNLVDFTAPIVSSDTGIVDQSSAPPVPAHSISPFMPSVLDVFPSNADFALMPETYLDTYTGSQLDNFMSVDFSSWTQPDLGPGAFM